MKAWLPSLLGTEQIIKMKKKKKRKEKLSLFSKDHQWMLSHSGKVLEKQNIHYVCHPQILNYKGSNMAPALLLSSYTPLILYSCPVFYVFGDTHSFKNLSRLSHSIRENLKVM